MTPDTVPPSLMQPSLGLGSQTPMHLVHISNLKLNAQIFSSRSLSIERRILIKNFLTALYQMHPIEWIEESPVDDQDEWSRHSLRRGLRARQRPPPLLSPSEHSIHSTGRGGPDEPILSPAAAAAASVVTSRRRPQSLRSSNVPLPRPVSMDLPVALQSYLSTVFDVNWSVGLSSTEDSLYTAKPGSHSPLRSPAPAASALSSVPPVSAGNSFSQDRAWRTQAGKNNSHHQPQMYQTPEGPDNANGWGLSRYGKTEYDEGDNNISSPQNQDGNHGYHRHQAGPDNTVQQKQYCQVPSGKPARLSPVPLPSTAYTSAHSQAHNHGQDNGHYDQGQESQTHIHNHIHIHIHNYPTGINQPQSSSASTGSSSSINSNERGYPVPVCRSSRYPKSEPLQTLQQQLIAVSRGEGSTSTYVGPINHDPVSSDFPLPPTTKPYCSAPIAIAAAGPLAPFPLLSPSPSNNSSALLRSGSEAYPPEKSTGCLSLGQEEEQLYLATAPPVVPVSSKYTRSLPPPPYTQSAEEEQQQRQRQEQQEMSYPRAMTQLSISPYHSSALTTKPQPTLPSSVSFVISGSGSSVSSSSTASGKNQKLIEYQQYEERQKMFLRDDDAKGEHSRDGLGFIKQLFRQGSKKKAMTTTMAGAVISAPLSSSASSGTVIVNSRTPFMLQDLVKQDLAKRLVPRRSRAG
ncbi:hypothetical protein BGZ54_010493 [Gamsiella multidivaricata]|nr:hypothetical protein BGZ54_010493 [Gamsiella multidivaricata]